MKNKKSLFLQVMMVTCLLVVTKVGYATENEWTLYTCTGETPFVNFAGVPGKTWTAHITYPINRVIWTYVPVSCNGGYSGNAWEGDVTCGTGESIYITTAQDCTYGLDSHIGGIVTDEPPPPTPPCSSSWVSPPECYGSVTYNVSAANGELWKTCSDDFDCWDGQKILFSPSRIEIPPSGSATDAYYSCGDSTSKNPVNDTTVQYGCSNGQIMHIGLNGTTWNTPEWGALEGSTSPSYAWSQCGASSTIDYLIYQGDNCVNDFAPAEGYFKEFNVTNVSIPESSSCSAYYSCDNGITKNVVVSGRSYVCGVDQTMQIGLTCGTGNQGFIWEGKYGILQGTVTELLAPTPTTTPTATITPTPTFTMMPTSTTTPSSGFNGPKSSSWMESTAAAVGGGLGALGIAGINYYLYKHDLLCYKNRCKNRDVLGKSKVSEIQIEEAKSTSPSP